VRPAALRPVWPDVHGEHARGRGEQKYDETVPAVVGCCVMGVGLPFSRIEKLQANFGYPLPRARNGGWLSLRRHVQPRVREDAGLRSGRNHRLQ